MEEEAALLRVTSRQNKRGRDTERIMGHPQRPRIVLDPTYSSFHHFPIAPNRELHLPRRRLGETLWWDIQAGNQDTKAFQEAIFISIQWLSRFTKGWALRTKGLCKQVTEARSQV
jgi:hypothetical protein